MSENVEIFSLSKIFVAIVTTANVLKIFKPNAVIPI